VPRYLLLAAGNAVARFHGNYPMARYAHLDNRGLRIRLLIF
jgi:hypothetical protein